MSKVYTSKEIEALQQPLDNKTGYSNPRFDKLYPKTKNPFHGTERDIILRKEGWRLQKFSSGCDVCGNEAEYISRINGQLEYKLCRSCYGKKYIKSDNKEDKDIAPSV